MLDHLSIFAQFSDQAYFYSMIEKPNETIIYTTVKYHQPIDRTINF